MLDQSPASALENRPDPVPVILTLLGQENEVIRTSAIRAAAALAPVDQRVREAFLASLLDEDPDVRTDAMDALVVCAQAEDGDVLRRSLLGDPVREVKHAAIKALSRLGDAESIAIFRKLVASRCADEIAWEDDNDAWDDWLDVQIAVIEALGQLGDTDSIEALLDARDDEQGQVLDAPVFAALAAMGSAGAVWLLSVAQTEKGLGRKRALEALAGMHSSLLIDYVDVLVEDENADVRRLALPLLQADDPRVEQIILGDPDPALRCEALKLFAPQRPEFATKALRDQSELVQAEALGCLVFPLEEELHAQLSVNGMAWVRLGTEKLAVAVAAVLPQLVPDQAAEVLFGVVSDGSRPLAVRIASLGGMAGLDDPQVTHKLISLLSNETQQVRTVALTQLCQRCRAGDEDSAQALAMSIHGELLSPEFAVVKHQEESAPDMAMSKVDDARVGRLRISRDGEILEVDEATETEGRTSTLAAVQLIGEANTPPALAEDTPEESAPKRRHRRAVEGPDTVADDLRVIATGVAGDIGHPAILAAVLEASTSESNALRLAAYRALSKRAAAGFLPRDVIVAAETGVHDEDPAVRSVSAEIIAHSGVQSDALAGCLADPDALVRAVAIRHAGTAEQGLVALGDTSSVVRDAALDKVLHDGAGDAFQSVLDVLLQAERIDTLARACGKSDAVLTLSIQALAAGDITPKKAFILLEAWARFRPATPLI